VPLEGLQREEAVELLNGVFGGPVEAAAGIYDELQEATLLSPHVAVLPEADPAGADAAGEEESGAGSEGGEPQPESSPGRDAVAEAMPEAEGRKDNGPPLEAPAQPADASLVDSTVPLEVGNEETLDLSLERNEDGTLEPVAPLVPTRIPGDLNDEIGFPETGISIEVAGFATERSASISSGSVAFYPNVAEDTDLAISPTPGGVETLTQLRSAASPNVSTYRFSLPSGASLVETEEGGAEVRSGEDLLLSVPAPTAIDAAGKAVPVNLQITGDTLEVHAEPDGDASLPILVDPLFQTYEWGAKNTTAGICSNSFEPFGEAQCNNREEWGYDLVSTAGYQHMQVGSTDNYTPGITIRASGSQNKYDHGTVLYTVPRYFKETPRPTSFIKSLKLSNVTWQADGPSASPYLFMGIWDATKASWVQYYQQTGQNGHGTNNPAFVYNFDDKFAGATEYDREAKVAQVGINATETTADSLAKVYVGAATVELGDEGAPKAPEPTPQTQWVNQSAPPIAFTAVDYGLGVYAISASTEEVNAEGKPLKTWRAAGGCIGVGDSACPQTWVSSKYNVYIPNAPALTYEPNVLPTGINYLKVVSEDPVGNKSSTSLEEVRVDHIAPTLAVTGSITEQEQLGTRRATYTLKANAADGNAEYPQSGIAKADVKIDGKTVAMEGKQAEEWSPKCATKNCPLSAEWTLNTAGLAEGSHTVEVIATDAVGLSTAKTLMIETRSATPPTLALSGSMTEQASLGTSRPRYVLKAKSTAVAAGFEAPTLGAPATYVATLGGTLGEGTGRFYEPADAATDTKGNVWVLDSQTRVANQLQEFNEKGEWLRSTGSAGYGKLKTPFGAAVDAGNNVWVADTGNNRIVEFNEKGEFVLTFGTGVNKTKVEAGGTEAEKNLCTAASGNVCQAATAGSLAGQLKSPQGIALTAGGNVWVADTGNSRIEKFGPTGNLLNNLSGEGTELGKLKSPSAITVAPDGSIWVADTGNNRIEQWNSSLAFVRTVGNKGTAAGEFQTPSGIEADSTGAIWVSDFGNGRVQEFDEFGTFLQKFNDAAGAAGSPRGLAVDAKGSIWVSDQYAFKTYRWTVPGFPVYASSIGSSGSGNGQFTEPVDVATDSSGNFWVLDAAQNRLQEFDATGKWLRTTGGAGAGAGKLSLPKSLATDSKGNVWVADTGNNRIVEFNEKGEFVLTFGTGVNKTKVEAGGTEAEKNLCTAASGNVCQAATAGSLAGQLKGPQGVALTAGGNIWVADTGNSRIEKFGPTGNMLNNISGEGTEPGKLKSPSAITVAPDGSIWVADTGNSRIEQWNSSLSLLRAVGKEGSGGGEFKSPAAIEADPSGNIWVGDLKNNRVEEFGEGGKYRGQFGANGSGKFSFSTATGVAVDASGSIWVADSGHLKVQKWTQEVPRSEITTTLWLDNNQQNGLHGTCKGSSCTIEPQWTVESKSLSAGSHSAKVKAVDGLGRSTESTVSFQISPDTTKPSLEAGGELVNAPEGWIEQDTYGFNATASDGGVGVTSIIFKIDGQQVASASQSCPDGGCKLTLSQQISMASYAGGAHPAELLATDGAGNTAKEQWTINVDPEGHISTQEVKATLEAVEGTSEEAPIAPNEELLEPEQMELGDNPELQQGGTSITSTGVPDLTTMTTNPAAGFTVTSPYGETTIVPKVTEGVSNTSIVEGVAGVSANAGSQVDSVVRPQYNGVQTFQAIRSEASPEKYSWTVHLYEGQVLQLADSHHAEVMYESGKRAFLISAEEAHDATGKEVPTSLEVSGNVLTLKVEFHSRGFVYPILAGAGWETSYRVPILIEGPEDQLEILDREKAEHEAAAATGSGSAIKPPTSWAEAEALLMEGGPDQVEAPPSPPSDGASASSSKRIVILEKYERCQEYSCENWNIWIGGGKESEHPHAVHGANYSEWVSGTTVICGYYISASYELAGGASILQLGCGFTGPWKVTKGEGKHLTVYSRFDVSVLMNTPQATWVLHDYIALQSYIWPNGFKDHVHQHWDGGPAVT